MRTLASLSLTYLDLHVLGNSHEFFKNVGKFAKKNKIESPFDIVQIPLPPLGRCYYLETSPKTFVSFHFIVTIQAFVLICIKLLTM